MCIHRLHIARALQRIPTHRQPPITIQALTLALGEDEAAKAIEATLALLHVFGALHQHGDGVRAKDQRATYFIQSLRLWLEQASDEDSLITSDLIRAMEAQRVRLAARTGGAIQPTRLQAAAFVLITRVMNDEVHVLCQLDRQAGQYQLIGGRLEPGETAAQAAEREFLEEVGGSQTPPLQVGVDFVLHELLSEPIMLDDLSPTYGALTRYAFHIFQAHVTRAALALGPDDAWIATRDLLRGHTADGKRMGNPRLYQEIDTRVAGGLMSLSPRMPGGNG